MIGRHLRVGAPSPLPITGTLGGGAGGECSLGVEDKLLGGSPYWHLPFVQNGINYVSMAGRDVTSYNFTGCIMATYKDGADVRVCHVSTGDGQDCKAAWDLIKGRAVNVFQFKPSDFIEANGAAFLGCYGLITADLQTYSITVVNNAVQGGGAKIAAVTKAHLLR